MPLYDHRNQIRDGVCFSTDKHQYKLTVLFKLFKHRSPKKPHIIKPGMKHKASPQPAFNIKLAQKGKRTAAQRGTN